MVRHLKLFSSKYSHALIRIFQSDLFLMVGLLLLFFVFFKNSLLDFFVADDFSWIRWASDSSPEMLLNNFVDAQGFFFRPIDKAIIYTQYQLFGLNPFPYKVINLIFNFFVSVGAYFILKIIFKKKSLAFLGVAIFSFLPSHTQDLFWFATISTTISTGFIFFGLYSFYVARVKKSFFLYTVSLFCMALAVFSYENAVIFILLMALFDIFLISRKQKKNRIQVIIPYIFSACIIATYLILRMQSNAAGFSGDYNYNLAKAIPNSAGNYLGYSIMVFSGENLLYVYSFLRETLKAYWLMLSVVAFFIASFIGGFIIEHKEKVRIPQGLKLFIFGFLFSVFSLLPYLPLGNITLRYAYLGSFGFIVMLVCITQKLILQREKKHSSVIYSALAICIIISAYIYMQQVGKNWKFASGITYNSFIVMQGLSGENIKNIYVYNVPIKYAEAYIFPVGFHDMVYLAGLEEASVFQLTDLEKIQGLSSIDKEKNVNYRKFMYDEEYNLRPLK